MISHSDRPVDSGAHQLDSLDQDHGPHLRYAPRNQITDSDSYCGSVVSIRNLPTSEDAVSGVAYPASEHQSLWETYNPQSDTAESYYSSLSSEHINRKFPLLFSFAILIDHYHVHRSSTRVLLFRPAHTNDSSASRRFIPCTPHHANGLLAGYAQLFSLPQPHSVQPQYPIQCSHGKFTFHGKRAPSSSLR